MEILDRLKRFIYPYEQECSVQRYGKNITVIKNTRSGIKEVTFNHFIYSRIHGDTLFTHSYWDFFLPIAYVYNNPRILMIGLGGGTIPYQLDKLLGDKVSLDVSEIDPDMVGIARKFYPAMRANVFVSDGFEFVKGKTGTYDSIFLDAYKDIDIPKEFLSREFIDNASNALTDDGILCINFAQTVLKAGELTEYSKRLSSHFRVYLINVSLIADNTIIVCSKRLDKSAIMKRIEGSMPRMKDNGHLFSAYRRMSLFR